MKRLCLLLAALILAAAFSGCSVVKGVMRSVMHLATPTPAAAEATIGTAPAQSEEPTPSPEAATAEPTEAAPTEAEATEEAAPTSEPTDNGVVYTSEYLGLSFTMPRSWAGNYYVFEGDGYLTVYFNPSVAPDPDVGDGEFFSILKKTENLDDSMFDNSKYIDIDGVTFIWGEPTDVRYQQGQAEYDTYVEMQKDLPDIQATVRAAD